MCVTVNTGNRQGAFYPLPPPLCWAQVREIEGKPHGPTPLPATYFLYHVTQGGEEDVCRLVVPRGKTLTALELDHSHPLGGHLGIHNTLARIQPRFLWPGMRADVERLCRTCPECQKTAPQKPPPAPLIPLPIIETPLERLGMDLVGPLPKSGRGHKYILVLVDYATRYPEAVPLRKATSKAIARELVQLFSRVGIPKDILTDQGTPFVSRLMADLCCLLQIHHLRTSVYHPQTDVLVERFNQTLKTMLQRVVTEDSRDWDLMIPYILFAVREVPQAPIGFTPFELLYGRRPRGLLDVVREAWKQQPSPLRTVIKHVREMEERIRRVRPIVKEHMEAAQRAQRRTYNRPTQPREFSPGDRVLVMIPDARCKFLAAWQGPYTVTEKLGPVTYRVHQAGKRKDTQTYHINLLKRWEEPEPPPLSAFARPL
ncbi:retrovirus-related Pol polyprotein from transposon 412 [Osmerus mordax]|uniref:retrovirus-related Pol polyprotein from transposon 412 n=1 Tax=Osmerus mordax TaxID=8014 RepID=UPI00350FCDD4